MITGLILRLIDPFYPLFRKFLDIQTYRYGVCGATNTAFDILLYFTIYHFVLEKKVLDLGLFLISPHIAAFFMAFMVSFPTGFFLMRLVVFPDSTIKGRVQLVRYFSVVLLNIFLNYALLKLFVDFCNFYPTPSKFAITVIIVGVTYLLQKHFTFKEKPPVSTAQQFIDDTVVEPASALERQEQEILQ